MSECSLQAISYTMAQRDIWFTQDLKHLQQIQKQSLRATAGLFKELTAVEVIEPSVLP